MGPTPHRSITTARVAPDQLSKALINAASQGLRPHCSDPSSHHLWLSDHEAERQIAITLCDHCTVLTVCRDTAEQRDERWGVWGGVDRSVRPRRKKAARPSSVAAWQVEGTASAAGSGGHDGGAGTTLRPITPTSSAPNAAMRRRLLAKVSNASVAVLALGGKENVVEVEFLPAQHRQPAAVAGCAVRLGE
jgi:hypothetical protein